jgi:sugar phosphate permease
MSFGKNPTDFTLRQFFAYIGEMCLAGAVIGFAADLMDWSTGVLYAVALTAGTAIFLFSMRESLFAPSSELAARRRQRHPSSH